MYTSLKKNLYETATLEIVSLGKQKQKLTIEHLKECMLRLMVSLLLISHVHVPEKKLGLGLAWENAFILIRK